MLVDLGKAVDAPPVGVKIFIGREGHHIRTSNQEHYGRLDAYQGVQNIVPPLPVNAEVESSMVEDQHLEAQLYQVRNYGCLYHPLLFKLLSQLGYGALGNGDKLGKLGVGHLRMLYQIVIDPLGYVAQFVFIGFPLLCRAAAYDILFPSGIIQTKALLQQGPVIEEIRHLHHLEGKYQKVDALLTEESVLCIILLQLVDVAPDIGVVARKVNSNRLDILVYCPEYLPVCLGKLLADLQPQLHWCGGLVDRVIDSQQFSTQGMEAGNLDHVIHFLLFQSAPYGRHRR